MIPPSAPVGYSSLSRHDGRLPGVPRTRDLVGDALRSVRAQPVPALVTSVVVGLVCMVVLLTTGRTAAAEREVLASVDSIGTRLIVVSDASGDAGIARSTVEQFAALRGVEWAFGLGPAVDVHNAALGNLGGGVAARPFVGAFPDVLRIVRGRAADQPGEAVVGAGVSQRLGLVDGAGPLSNGSEQYPAVGVVEGEGALAFLDETVLWVAPDAEEFPVRFIYVVVDTVGDIEGVSAAMESVVIADRPEQVKIESSQSAIVLREVIAGSLGASSRQVMAGVLATGLLLVSASTFASVSARRRDFGRRRALGASRTAIVFGVTVQTAAAAVPGVVVGCAAGLVGGGAFRGYSPGIGFILAVGVLAFLVALVGAVIPAVIAARRDPVRILRVP